VIGSQTNIEIAYAATSYVKSKGIGVANLNFVSTQLPIDVPYFYSLNKSFTDFGLNTFNTIFQIGTNLRYEASLFNTILRREQTRRGIAYFSLSSFSSLRYAHTHQGNSFSTLYSVYENRLSFVQEHYVQSKELAIVVGVNSFRHNYSSFYQEMIRQVGKLFFVKLGSKERLGFIHNSVGSLAFSHLGFSSKKLKAQSIISCAQPSHIQSYNLNNQLGSSYLIDITSSNKSVQAKSLYETAGSLISCHGQIRKHSKVINEITDNVSKHNFEVEMISL
jgi:hypothetical protein